MGAELSVLLMLVGFIVLLFLIQFLLFLRSFGTDLRIINEEIKRSDPASKPRWKRARRRLFLSLIPFYKPKRRKKHR